MKNDSTISGSEVLLGVIAIRLAVLVVAGWSLFLLPQPARETELACAPSSATRTDALAPPTSNGASIRDAARDDMLMHD